MAHVLADACVHNVEQIHQDAPVWHQLPNWRPEGDRSAGPAKDQPGTWRQRAHIHVRVMDIAARFEAAPALQGPKGQRFYPDYPWTFPYFVYPGVRACFLACVSAATEPAAASPAEGIAPYSPACACRRQGSA